MMTALVSGGSGWPVLIQKAPSRSVNCWGRSMLAPKVSSAQTAMPSMAAAMEIGRGEPGEDRFGQDPAQGFRGGDFLISQHGRVVQAVKEKLLAFASDFISK